MPQPLRYFEPTDRAADRTNKVRTVCINVLHRCPFVPKHLCSCRLLPLFALRAPCLCSAIRPHGYLSNACCFHKTSELWCELSVQVRAGLEKSGLVSALAFRMSVHGDWDEFEELVSGFGGVHGDASLLHKLWVLPVALASAEVRRISNAIALT